MRIVEVVLVPPKSREAALNQASYMSHQIDICLKRRENMDSSREAAEAKLLRLEKTLESLNQQLSALARTESNWKEKLEVLKTEYSLTEAEILETKSSLLRKQIRNLESFAGKKDSGKTTEI